MPYCGVPLYVLYINIECLMDVRKASTTLSTQGREGKGFLGGGIGWVGVGWKESRGSTINLPHTTK